MTIATSGALTYRRTATAEIYVYPIWTVWLGWTMASCVALLVPGIAAYRIFNTEGAFFEVKVKEDNCIRAIAMRYSLIEALFEKTESSIYANRASERF
ncbi:unnamed protein product [Protopolystoma xenopodis]|uniref:Uncharacterized protein n=1 Tax=Protopolystoma xenopodis TaxID=117903 RepID=A0A448WD65_9PLAT|nr:unnamed protein product [Protopolystoma xenopodis]